MKLFRDLLDNRRAISGLAILLASGSVDAALSVEPDRLRVAPVEAVWQPPVTEPIDVDAMLAAARSEPAPEWSRGVVEVVSAGGLEVMQMDYLDDMALAPTHGGDRSGIEAVHLTRGTMGLLELAELAERTDLLECRRPNRCQLAAPLVIAEGATLLIHGLDLALAADRSALIADGGVLDIRNAVIRAVDGAMPAAFASQDRFRAFIAAVDKGRLVILDSKLFDLGYRKPRAYGITLDQRRGHARPSAIIAGSHIDGFYRGYYSNHASDIAVIGNRVTNSIEYGIDPHDFTTDIVIVGNRVTGTRERHGIVLSNGVARALIADNVVTGSGGSGLVIDRRSTDMTITGNRFSQNADDGVAVYESADLRVHGNELSGNGRVGLRVRNGVAVVAFDNRIKANSGFGLDLHTGVALDDGEPSNDDVARLNEITLANNHLVDNAAGTMKLAGNMILTLAAQPASEGHRFAGSRQWVQTVEAYFGRLPVRIEPADPVSP